MAITKEQCVVIIPIHSEKPTKFEIVSFIQCFNVLANHPIKVLAPLGMDLTEYYKLINNFDIIIIDPIWQSSLENYNKLKYSCFFYKLLNHFQFILTYELDAFIFYDKLEEWCKKDFDYIGAPWFEGFNNPTSKEIIGVGNSGFSLRKTETFSKILKKYYHKDDMEYKRGNKRLFIAKIKYPWRKIMNLFSGENYTLQKLKTYIPEDQLFCGVINKKYNLNIAPIDEAVNFAFEVNPEFLFELNGKKLPMGCHAWTKYDFDFWRPFIIQFGYQI